MYTNYRIVHKIFITTLFIVLTLTATCQGQQRRKIAVPGSLEILNCEYLPNSRNVWAISMDYDPGLKQQTSMYSILKITPEGTISQYNTKIPVGKIVTPYQGKSQILYFKIINNHVLHAGIKLLDGTIYQLKFDTLHPNSQQHVKRLRLKGSVEASSIFITQNGHLAFIGSENSEAYVGMLNADRRVIWEKKGLGLPKSKGKLKLSILLNNDAFLLIFNTYHGENAGTGYIALIDNQGKLLATKKIQGLIVGARPSGNDGAIILIGHDLEGKDMEAQALDSHLNLLSHYPVPGFYKIFDPAGQLLAQNKMSLLSMQIDRRSSSSSLVKLETYSPKGTTKFGTIISPQPGMLRAYNADGAIKKGTLYIGVAVIGIAPSNKGQKTYFIHSLPVH